MNTLLIFFALPIAVIIMFIFIIKGLLSKETTTGKITTKNYFATYKDNKWGVIDSAGNDVIDPSYKEMIVVPNSKSAVFICTYDVNYETGEYKTKALNEKNQEIFTGYDQIEPIQNTDKSKNLTYDKNVIKIKKAVRALDFINADPKKRERHNSILMAEINRRTSEHNFFEAGKEERRN